MDEIISYKMCAVKVRNAKLRNYPNKAFYVNNDETGLLRLLRKISRSFALSLLHQGNKEAK